MAMQTGKENSKIRVIAIYCELMKKKTVTTNQLMKMLRCRYGIIVDRKTIYDDVRAINRFAPIKSLYGRNGGYIYWDVLKEAEDENKI